MRLPAVGVCLSVPVQAVKLNVFHTMNFMLKHCDAIREKVRSGHLEIQGGVYDLSTGKAPGFRKFALVSV